MRYRYAELSAGLDYRDQELPALLAARFGGRADEYSEVCIKRRSIDGRDIRRGVVFVLAVEFSTDRDLTALCDGKLTPAVDNPVPRPIVCKRGDHFRPVVIGAGPAGLFAALYLAEAGLEPVVLERGVCAEERSVAVGKFWGQGELDPENNALYGEGGAGLFSDGKLNTRSKLQSYVQMVLTTLSECGAQAEVLMDGAPHIGSDRLLHVIPAMRRRILAAGGEIRFSHRVDTLQLDNGRLCGLRGPWGEVETRHCILAAGHSATDLSRHLIAAGVPCECKGFALGLRCEVPQDWVDATQYGSSAGHPRLGAASFRLTRRASGQARSCYTFCMCPGGRVISCASASGRLTTNGMSLSTRSGQFANAAFLVPVEPHDINSEAVTPVAALDWLERIEENAYRQGGGNYSLPASSVSDFLNCASDVYLPEERSCQRAQAVNLHHLLPEAIDQTLIETLQPMLSRLKPEALEKCILYGVETRSTSPIRFLRGKDFASTGVAGLFPAGEGAGYAGGIVTSAIDGYRAAEALAASLD